MAAQFMIITVVVSCGGELVLLSTFCDVYRCKIAGIYGGNLLGIRSVSGLAFYDWESSDLVRRIEITPKNVSCGLSSQIIFII